MATEGSELRSRDFPPPRPSPFPFRSLTLTFSCLTDFLSAGCVGATTILCPPLFPISTSQLLLPPPPPLPFCRQGQQSLSATSGVTCSGDLVYCQLCW